MVQPRRVIFMVIFSSKIQNQLNHEKASEYPKLRDILGYNRLLYFNRIKFGKNQETHKLEDTKKVRSKGVI